MKNQKEEKKEEIQYTYVWTKRWGWKINGQIKTKENEKSVRKLPNQTV